jgi:hypothetical protein
VLGGAIISFAFYIEGQRVTQTTQLKRRLKWRKSIFLWDDDDEMMTAATPGSPHEKGKGSAGRGGIQEHHQIDFLLAARDYEDEDEMTLQYKLSNENHPEFDSLLVRAEYCD